MARELCAYTLRITANPKKFPVDQKSFTEKIRDVAIDIYTLCWEANNIKVDNRMDRYLRRIGMVAKSKRGGIPRQKVDEAYAAWRNHASKGNSYRLLCRMDEYYRQLWKEDDVYVS